MRPRVLVIGRQGQLAAALPAALAAAGFEAIVAARPDCDVTSADSMRRAVARARPALVINPAAYTAVDRAESDADAAFAVNRDGARHVAASAAQAQIPIVHVSTDYVFDGTRGAPYVETDATAPLGVYGCSKLAGEAAVAAANPRHVILRTAWVCSPTGSNFLKTMLRLAVASDEIGVVDDQRGSPTFADDLAAAAARVAANLVARPADGSLTGVFHLTSAGATTWCGFAQRIFERSAARGGPSARVRPISTADYPTAARRPADSRLDCSRIADRHGIVLPDWRDGLEPCLDRLLEYRRVQEAAS